MRRLLFWGGIACLGVVLYCVASVLWLRTHNPQKTSFQKLREAQGIATRGATFVPLSEMSPHLIRATLAGEDQLFWEHNGFDYGALWKAALKNLEEGKVVRGGSTISQQLAKNLFLGEERSLVRKGQEAFFTILLEAFLSKERILELYLNVIEWGEGIYGAEAAAQLYFGRSARELSKDEAATLAAMIPNPRTAYHPVKNPQRHQRKKRFILKWMPSISPRPTP